MRLYKLNNYDFKYLVVGILLNLHKLKKNSVDFFIIYSFNCCLSRYDGTFLTLNILWTKKKYVFPLKFNGIFFLLNALFHTKWDRFFQRHRDV